MNVLVNNRGSRGARRRARTRAAILDAAERAFTELGYRRTRMEDVAEEADVAVGSIYGHFGNKDGLYLAVVERAVELFARYMRQAYQPQWSPLEQVVACGDAYLRFHIEHPGGFRLLAFDGVETDAPEVDPHLRARVSAGIDALITEFQDKVQSAIDAGEARPLDARLAGRFLWGAWNGVVALGLRNDGLALSEADIHDALQQARDIVLAGLCAPSARDSAGAPQAGLRAIVSPAPLDASDER
jgi:TetR/AcrR family transcriptional regulator